MGFSILSNDVYEKNKYPIYGNINFASALDFAYRPNGIRSFDLSGNDFVISEGGKNTSNGFTGGQNDPCTTNYKDTSNDLTIISVLRAVDLLPTANNRSWPISCYSENEFMGIGALITADSLAGGALDTKLRIYFGCSDGTKTSRFSVPDLIINPKLQSASTPYLYLIIRINSTTNTIKVNLINLKLSSQIKVPDAYNINYQGRGGQNKQPWMMGARHSGVANTANSNVIQLLCYNKYLSDSEIMLQYKDDLGWLNAEHGIEMQ